jgi:hypothetical protein
MQRRRLRYLLTPQGLTEKARLTRKFMQASLYWYRETRDTSKAFLEQIEQAGYDTVCIEGDGDLAEIIYLTCLEVGVDVKEKVDWSFPVFKIEGLKTLLDWPEGTVSGDSG